MKVPGYIKEAIYKCADYNNKAKEYENIAIKWFEKKHLTEETAKDISRVIDDTFIDCCQLGFNPQLVIEVLENMEG